MAEPIHDTDHVAEGVDRLTSQYKHALESRSPDVYKRPVIYGILRSWLNRVQALEDNAWSVITGRLLDDATGIRVDVIGKLVGEKRNGKSDADFKQIIRLRIRANRTQGRTTDLVDLAILAAPVGVTPVYREFWPNGAVAAWEVTIDPGLVNPADVGRIMQYAKAAGTYGKLVYSAGSEASFTLDNTAPMGLGAEGELSDSVSATLGTSLSGAA